MKNYYLLNISAELFKFIIDPENYNETKFDVEWLKIFYWDSYIEKFSKIEYIVKKTEEYLLKNQDEELVKIYFKMKANI